MTISKTRLTVTVWLVLLSMLAAALACGTPDSTPPPATQPPDTQPASDAESGGENKAPGETASGSLTLTNESSTDVCYVYISPTSADSWGEDWLGSDVVAAGTQYTFALEEGAWDFKAEDCNHELMDEQYDINVGTNTTWTLSDMPGSSSGQATLRVVNETGDSICYIYVSSSTSDQWGNDLLGVDLLLADNYHDFAVEPGVYDLRADDCAGNEIEVGYGINVSAEGATWTVHGGGTSSGGQTAIQVVNDTSTDLCYVYISPSSASEWGNDWLGADVIPAGSTYTFSVAPNTYDLKAEDCSHNEMATQMQVVVSAEGVTWTLSGGAAQPGGGQDAAVCGNGICEAGEGNEVCVADCGYPGALCGDGVCGDFENTGNCTADCGFNTDCGDGVCDQWEDYTNCPMDCPLAQPGAATVPVTFVNQTSEPVCWVYWGYPQSEWLGDALGSSIIDGWGQITVELPAGETLVLQAQDCSEAVMKTSEFTPTSGATWYIDP